MNLTLQEQYNLLTSTNLLHQRYRDTWEYLLNSYMGGIEYSRGNYLTKYVNETANEYNARIAATHLENHCKSVISTYISFLFRTPPDRDFDRNGESFELEMFLRDADMDGRSFDAFMKEVSVWSSVFGMCWVLVVKPDVGAVTLADQQQQGVRPYVNLITPLTVSDWNWRRNPNGSYELDYFKYVEDANDSTSTIKEWYLDRIITSVINHKNRELQEQFEEVNGLGKIPAVVAYNHRSPVRGIGVSDISDIAHAQQAIYNLTSECEQSVRINGHPALVKTVGSEASAGAGAIISMEDNLDPGLRPYMLAVSTDIQSIFTAIEHATSAIDKMANTGSVRSTESRRMSGVAQEQEFQLLNAKLSEKADNLELAEEQIWQYWFEYMGQQWMGEVDYPGSFSIRDTQADVEKLVKAKSAATDPRVLTLIDHELVELLGEDPLLVLGTTEYLPAEQLPAQEPFEPHKMIDPETGDEYIARTEQEHLDYAARGYVHEDE